jgi:hypothetical protein
MFTLGTIASNRETKRPLWTLNTSAGQKEANRFLSLLLSPLGTRWTVSPILSQAGVNTSTINFTAGFSGKSQEEFFQTPIYYSTMPEFVSGAQPIQPIGLTIPNLKAPAPTELVSWPAPFLLLLGKRQYFFKKVTNLTRTVLYASEFVCSCAPVVNGFRRAS